MCLKTETYSFKISRILKISWKDKTTDFTGYHDHNLTNLDKYVSDNVNHGDERCLECHDIDLYVQIVFSFAQNTCDS